MSRGGGGVGGDGVRGEGGSILRVRGLGYTKHAGGGAYSKRAERGGILSVRREGVY